MPEPLSPADQAEVDRVFDEFWAEIVAPTGTVDIELVKIELRDYYMTIVEVARVYDEITQGRITKVHTHASAVLRVHDEVCHTYCRDDEEDTARRA